MSHLYIVGNGSRLGIDGGYFVIEQKDGLIRKIPKETLESIVIFGNCSVTTPCINSLLANNIPVSYFSSKGKYFGRFVSTSNQNIVRIKKQFFLCENKGFRTEISKKFLAGKISNQKVVLKRYSDNNNIDITQNMIQIKSAEKKIILCDSGETLMGYEGTAAKYYFDGLSKLVKKEFAFDGRKKRPPRDPFNSMLSLGYTLLMYEIYAEIESRSLNPYAGFLHRDQYSHPALASDLMEEWRPVIVDSMVLSMIQRKEIHIEDFESDEETGAVWLNNTSLKRFIKKFEEKLNVKVDYIKDIESQCSFRKAIWHQIGRLVSAIESEDGKKYMPIQIR